MLLFLCENLIWFLQEFDLTLFRANQIFSTNFVQFFRTNLRKQKIQQRKIQPIRLGLRFGHDKYQGLKLKLKLKLELELKLKPKLKLKLKLKT